MKKTGLYIHIPFCVKKCKYCAFLSAPADDIIREKYVCALIDEIRQSGENQARGRTVSTVYLGGGTPSVLSASQISRIMGAVYDSMDVDSEAEITIEANPGTLGSTEKEIYDKLLAYRCSGINRLSMGVQSMNDDVLKFIGRIHTPEDVRRDFRIARSVGFNNINLDLIFSLPVSGCIRPEKSERAIFADSSCERNEIDCRRQAVADLEEILQLKPEHISCYSLQIEEGTPFAEMFSRGEIDEVSDECDRETYHELCRILKKAGYEHYEISNFARTDGMASDFDERFGSASVNRSRHNSLYWDMSDYCGAGLGASGFVSGVRYRNTEDMKRYLSGNDIRIEEHKNTEHDNISEAVFTGLRRIEGLRYRELPEKVNSHGSFWTYYEAVRDEADGFGLSGHLVIDDEGLRLTEAGIDISNAIMALFV